MAEPAGRPVAHVCLLVPVHERLEQASGTRVVEGTGQAEPLGRAVTLVRGLTRHFGVAVSVKVHPVFSPFRAWWCVVVEAVKRRAGLRSMLRAFFVRYRLPAVVVEGRVLVSGRWPSFAEIRDLVSAFASDSVPTGPIILNGKKKRNSS